MDNRRIRRPEIAAIDHFARAKHVVGAGLHAVINTNPFQRAAARVERGHRTQIGDDIHAAVGNSDRQAAVGLHGFWTKQQRLTGADLRVPQQPPAGGVEGGGESVQRRRGNLHRHAIEHAGIVSRRRDKINRFQPFLIGFALQIKSRFAGLQRPQHDRLGAIAFFADAGQIIRRAVRDLVALHLAAAAKKNTIHAFVGSWRGRLRSQQAIHISAGQRSEIRVLNDGRLLDETVRARVRWRGAVPVGRGFSALNRQLKQRVALGLQRTRTRIGRRVRGINLKVVDVKNAVGDRQLLIHRWIGRAPSLAVVNRNRLRLFL